MDTTCEIRAQIARRIADAEQEVHRIRGDRKSPRDEHALALQQAIDVKRKAERDLNDNVKQHGCKMHRGRLAFTPEGSTHR
jgi:hypothetical protein